MGKTSDDLLVTADLHLTKLRFSKSRRYEHVQILFKEHVVIVIRCRNLLQSLSKIMGDRTDFPPPLLKGNREQDFGRGG